MTAAKKGDTVRVHYTGKLDNGAVFDSSLESGEPLEFTIGDEEIISGFSSGIVGMKPGETKTITIGSKEAYGPHIKELVSQIERMYLPADLPLEIGQQLEISDKEEKTPIVVTVTAVNDDAITIDANHPLAGKDLTFEIELVHIDQ